MHAEGRSITTVEQERERQLVETFVELSDTLVDDFDVVDFLHRLTARTVQLGLASQTGILLRDEQGALHVMAASEEEARVLEMLQVEGQEGGPCVACVSTGEPMDFEDLATARSRWPRFVEAALSLGLQSVHAVPLRLRSHTLGAMNLFGGTRGPLPASDRAVARGLAHVATIGLLQQQNLTDSHEVTRQLQHALDSRVVVEQAKGIIAQQAGLAMTAAFEVLRNQARNTNQRVHEVAEQVVAETLAVADLRIR